MDNLMKIIEEDRMDIICIQEPYAIHNKIVGIPKKHKIFVYGEGRHWAAIVVTNKSIDTLLIKHLSDEDTVVLEVVNNKVKIILGSMYFDLNQQIENDLNKIEAIIQHAKGAGVLLTMDSKSRSTSWHDSLTNARGRLLEEFLISKQLHIMNEESAFTTFRSSQGSSNIDLTVISNHLLRAVEEWEISEQESCLDHSIIKFAIGQGKGHRIKLDSQEVRYIVKREYIDIFQGNLLQLLEEKLSMTNKEGGTEDLDGILSKRAHEKPDIEESIEEFHEMLKTACDKSFRKKWASKKVLADKSIPWWTEELTVKRKRTNALRRRYHRTRNNDELRKQRKASYIEGKARYEATIKKEKIN